MKIAAVVLALIVVVAVVAVVAMPRDVSVEKEGDGTLSFEGEKSLRAFGSLEIDIQPGDGCFAKVYLDGDEVASDVTSYRYDAPFADFSKHEIKVVFERSAPVPDEKVTLTVQAGNGGTVDPVGSKKVVKGSVETLEITPDDGYVIDEVKIDGQNVSVCNVMDVKMDGDRTVSVTFRPVSAQDIAVTIDVDAKIEIRTTGGEIDFGKVVPSGEVKVKPGSSLKVSILLNPGFEIEDFKVDGKSVGKVTEYTIENIQKSVGVSISVIKNVDGYTIKASAGNGGKISPSGDVKIEKGKDATFTFSANSGYVVSDVTVDGKKVIASGSYTFKAVSENHTISVSFKYVGGGGGGDTPSKTLTKIEVTQQPTKTTYWKDETFDSNGMEVTATYSDGSTRVLAASEYSISPSVMTKDTTEVTVSYGGKTCDVPVTVKYVKKLEIERIDGRTWYKVGEIVTKDVLKVTATISDGTTEVAEDYEIAPSAPLKKDDQLSVTYRGYTKTVFIDIYELDHITADTEKNTYLIGEDFDKDSMTVTAFYKNGSGEHEERVTDFSIDQNKSDEAGNCTVTVGYQGKTCTLTLTIVDPNEITSIFVDTKDMKTEYFDNTKLDTTGLVVTGTTSSASVIIPAEKYEVSEGSADASGNVEVTVTYKDKSTITTKFTIKRTLDIHDLADLKQFRDNVNAESDSKDYSGMTITLKDDIDLKNENWTPIGLNADAPKKFKGTFDGGSHTIKNLKVETEPGYAAAGFFGTLNGIVKDLKFETASISHVSVGNADGQTSNGIAVVAGSIYNSGSIENVTVKDATVQGNRYLAGIAGYVYGSVKNCSVENIVLIASPNVYNGTMDNADKVGGIVGYFPFETANTVEKCTANGVTITAYRDAGCIAGYASGDKLTGNVVKGINSITIDRTLVDADKAINAGAIIGYSINGAALASTNEVMGSTSVDIKVKSLRDLEKAIGFITPGAKEVFAVTVMDDISSETITNIKVNGSMTVSGTDTKEITLTNIRLAIKSNSSVVVKDLKMTKTCTDGGTNQHIINLESDFKGSVTVMDVAFVADSDKEKTLAAICSANPTSGGRLSVIGCEFSMGENIEKNQKRHALELYGLSSVRINNSTFNDFSRPINLDGVKNIYASGNTFTMPSGPLATNDPSVTDPLLKIYSINKDIESFSVFGDKIGWKDADGIEQVPVYINSDVKVKDTFLSDMDVYVKDTKTLTVSTYAKIDAALSIPENASVKLEPGATLIVSSISGNEPTATDGSEVQKDEIGSQIKYTVGYTKEKVKDQTVLNSTISAESTTKDVDLILPENEQFTLDSGIAHEGGKSRDVTFVGDGTQTVDVAKKGVQGDGAKKINYQRGSTFTFRNLTIQAGEDSFDGIVCDELTFIDCTIKGKPTLYGKATFINCTFDNTMEDQYSIWTWGGTDLRFENCTFNTNGKAILLYGYGPTNLVVKDCTFNDRNNGTAGKAAIEIGNDYNATYTLTIDNATVNGFAEGKNTGSTLWANKNSMDAAHLTVTIDGKKVQ